MALFPIDSMDGLEGVPNEPTLSGREESGQNEISSVLHQRSYTGNKPVIKSFVADTPCFDLEVDELLEKLNGILGTSYIQEKLSESLRSALESCVHRDYDFGTAYARLRPYWVKDASRDIVKDERKDQDMRNQLLVDNKIKIIDGDAPPRRVWDLYANRVVPYWVVGKYPWVISHAWVNGKELIHATTPINQREWPVPIPKDANLDLIRIEMLNLGAEYVWLDVLCLRQEQLTEIRRKEELREVWAEERGRVEGGGLMKRHMKEVRVLEMRVLEGAGLLEEEVRRLEEEERRLEGAHRLEEARREEKHRLEEVRHRTEHFMEEVYRMERLLEEDRLEEDRRLEEEVRRLEEEEGRLEGAHRLEEARREEKHRLEEVRHRTEHLMEEVYRMERLLEEDRRCLEELKGLDGLLKERRCHLEERYLQMVSLEERRPLEEVRKEYRKGEYDRLEEWKVDVPTIGWVYREAGQVVCYFGGLGRPLTRMVDFESNRSWFKRAWTLQEMGIDPIIAGRNGPEENIPAELHTQLESLRQIRRDDFVFDILIQMRERKSTKLVDRVAALVYLFHSEYIPIYNEDQSEENAWTALLNVTQDWFRADLFFFYPEPGGGKKVWRPSWSQAMKHTVSWRDPSQVMGKIGRRKEEDVDYHRGPYIESAEVWGLDNKLKGSATSAQKKSRRGELHLKDSNGKTHTFKIIVDHTYPIPDGPYTLIGSTGFNSTESALLWVVGKMEDEKFKKISVFSMADDRVGARLQGLEIAEDRKVDLW